MTRRRAVVGPLVLAAMMGLVVLVVAGVGDPWPARAGIRTIAVSPGSGPFALVADSTTGRAFLNGTDSFQLLDIASGAVLHRTTVRLAPLRLAPNGEWPATIVPDERSGRVFAIARPLFGPGADQVTVLNAASGHQVRTLRLPVGSHADQVVVDERRGRAYVLLAPSTGRTLTVPVLDATSGRNAHTGRVVRTIVVVGVPTNLVVSQRLGRVFVSTTGPSGLRVTTGREGNGSVHVLDGRSGTIVRTWPVGRLPRTNLAGGTAPQPHGHG